MQQTSCNKDSDNLASLVGRVLSESYEVSESEDAESPIDLKSLDAEQFEDLLHSLFTMTLANAEETGDIAFEDTAGYLRLAHEAYQNRRGN